MSVLFRSNRKTKNSADNSNKVEVNVDNNIMNQVYITLLENTKILGQISTDISYVKENINKLSGKVETIDGRVSNLETRVQVLEHCEEDRVKKEYNEKVKKLGRK